MDAFNELALCRPLVMGGIGYIPLTEVLAWGVMSGVDDLETLWRHVHALDAVYVKDFAEKQARDANQSHRKHADGHQPDQS